MPQIHDLDKRSMTSLRVDNITSRTTVEDLRRLFERYGFVGDVFIPKDKYTQESLKYAFVRYFNLDDATDAREILDGFLLDGQSLRVKLDCSRMERDRGTASGSSAGITSEAEAPSQECSSSSPSASTEAAT